MKIRITGLPAEVSAAVAVLTSTDGLDVIEVSDPYPNRGDSRLVRVYVETQLPPGTRTIR